jgi:2-polyprenyl-3-methyl-5-hydroxy-6-metoxy-1,4-benzoquinol methylase
MERIAAVGGSQAMTDEQLKAQQEHYDRTWVEGLEAGREELGNLQTNLEFLAQTDLLRPGDRILEVGCGTGGLVAALTEKGHDVLGTDISPAAIGHGRAKHAEVRLEVSPAEELNYDNASFDAVLSFDLLEHVVHVGRHLDEVRRVLKPGGHYLFQTPNKWSNILFELLRTRSFGWRRYHPSLHTPGQLRRRLRRHGFSVEFVRMNPINEFTLKKIRRLVGPMGGLFRHVDFRRLPLYLQTNLYVVARKCDTGDRSPP